MMNQKTEDTTGNNTTNEEHESEIVLDIEDIDSDCATEAEAQNTAPSSSEGNASRFLVPNEKTEDTTGNNTTIEEIESEKKLLEIEEFDSESDTEAEVPPEGYVRRFLVPIPISPNPLSRDGNRNGRNNRLPGVERIPIPISPNPLSRDGNRNGRNNRLPGVERIYPRRPGVSTTSIPTPEAYPVYPVNTNFDSNNNVDSLNERRERTRRSNENDCKFDANSFILPGVLFVAILVTVFLSVNFKQFGLSRTNQQQTAGENSGNNNSSLHSTNNETFITDKENIKDYYSSQPTRAPSSKVTGNPTVSEPELKCFIDPWEISILEEVAYKNGVHPHIPRTYHFCPNIHLKIQLYNYEFGRYDENSGDYKALHLFRPNVSIKCGFDGSFENNCTFSGGNHIISLIPFSVFDTNKVVEPGPENITVEGFRFTGSYRGSSVVNNAVYASLTLKNCVFDHNYESSSAIFSAPHYAIKSTLIIQNCTFENNTYKYFRAFPPRPNIGVIVSHGTLYATVNTYISNSVFRNETFIIDDEPETIPSVLNDHLLPPEDVFVNGAIINLATNMGVLDITDSCFIGNIGYTDSLIIMDKDNRTVLGNSHGNYISDNEPRESESKLSCILLYQNISYDIWPMGVFDEDEQSCSDHLGFENDNRTNPMCLI